MKKIVVLLGIVVFYTTAQGQYVADALKYSQNFPAITARSLGMGGAFTSLGGDVSAAMYNPAGLGVYRKSELMLTPALSVTNTSANYLGKTNDDSRAHFNFGSFGYVGTMNTHKDKGLVSASLGLVYVRQSTFNSQTFIRGTNPTSSISDYFQGNAEGQYPENLDPFYERLAFDTYVIDTIPGYPTSYQPYVPLPIDQKKIIETSGGIGKWSIATGLNFSNIVYVGAGFGIHQLQYDRTTVHTENDNNQANDFSQLAFTEDVKIDGVAYTGNVGMIVRLFKIMRVGGSIQFPTSYKIQESYYNVLTSQFKNGDHYLAEPTDADGNLIPGGVYEYKLHTPMKMQGGLSLQIGTIGIISADMEYVNYNKLELKPTDYESDFSLSNSDINSIYKSVVNFKAGGEVRFSNFAVRLGGGYYPSPLKTFNLASIYPYDFNAPKAHTELSSGLGYRNNNFFFDFGFSWLAHTEDYHLYTVNLDNNPSTNVASLKQNEFRMLATIGVRF
jgi:hypothetical protein